MESKLKEDYVEPAYLVEWINQSLAKHPSGLFLLNMEQGMGKTTFIRGLDPLSIGKTAVGATTRVFYINSFMPNQKNSFQTRIIDALRTIIVNHQRILIDKVKDFSSAASTPNQFVDILAAYQQVHVEQTGIEKLLFIIDGLDKQ